MMNSRSKRMMTAVALLLVFATSQIYLGVSFAEGNLVTRNSVKPQDAAGVLTTRGNKPITVNGQSAITGTTIISGAGIETPEGVSASINFPQATVLEISPQAKLSVEFDQQGNVKVMLIHGCVTLRENKDVTGEIDGPNGVRGKTDPAKGGVLKVCEPSRGGLFGIGVPGTVAVVGGGAAAVIVPLIVRGRNPSPATP